MPSSQTASLLKVRNLTEKASPSIVTVAVLTKASATLLKVGFDLAPFVEVTRYQITCMLSGGAAESLMRNFPPANGARVVYLGCFLRSCASCGNQIASDATAFLTTLSGLLADLQVATPKINGFFAASKRAINGQSSSNKFMPLLNVLKALVQVGAKNACNWRMAMLKLKDVLLLRLVGLLIWDVSLCIPILHSLLITRLLILRPS
ncbi:hypothetical protein Patl1_29197 [Pistacia atlantica]|uniref:Uncharacterized protein n=1 Tax=Pistacia atlantica TaxID=434234 RepID=A0ACC1BEN2_9ROSI|nr:hypothetical protein Patl1_29197 [Pistacia atlantica]